MPLRFLPGSLCITPGAAQAIAASGDSILEFLARHVSGDWGELDDSDLRENELSLEHSWRILSCYRLSSGTRIWLITEADRAATTFLLPEEY